MIALGGDLLIAAEKKCAWMEAHSAAQGGAENCRHLRELGIKTSSNFQVPTHRHVSRRTREKAKARRPYVLFCDTQRNEREDLALPTHTKHLKVDRYHTTIRYLIIESFRSCRLAP